MTTQLKVGDLVRVLGRCDKRGGTYHSFKNGQVVEVEVLSGWNGVAGYIRCISLDGYTQSLALHQVKPAKQAMRKRDEYANRRG